jgi:hypothetical protein
MSRYIGNYLRVPSLEPQQASAPGIWSLSDQLAYQRANVWPPARDPYYNQTVLHLSGDVAATRETNPVTQPRTFLSDASTNNFLLTPNGDVSARPFNPYLNNYSAFFDGTNDYCSLAGSAEFSISTSTTPFTVEAWIYPTSTSAVSVIWTERYNGAGNTVSLACGLMDGSSFWTAGRYPGFSYYNGSGWTGAASNSQVELNTWSHVAYVFTGSACKIFLNGVDVTKAGGPTTWAITGVSGEAWYIGTNWDIATYFSGYISNLRYVVGTAVYTSNFTPSTAPLQNITNTKLLACQSNRFIDNSSSPKTITPVNGAAVSQNSPFVEYDTTSGSGYFDGSGDYLTAPASTQYNFGTGNFTIQGWIYIDTDKTIAGANGGMLFSYNFESIQIYYVNSPAYFYVDIRGWGTNISLQSTSQVVKGQWYHLAVIRDGVTSTKLYVNGVLEATNTTNPGSVNLNAQSLYTGVRYNPSGGALDYYHKGYISGFRITNTAVDTTTLLALPSPISGTQLLTLQTRAPANNQGILDTSPNRFEVTRTGNVAQGSFSPFSASGYSVSTTATNTLDLPGSVLAFGSSSFTLEAWVYATHTSGAPIVYPYNSGNTVTSGGFSVSFGTGGVGYYAVNGATPINYSATIPLNTWYHLALVKDGSAARLYLNGQLVATGTDSTTYTTPTGGARVGGIYNLTQTYGLVVNNLRIVTGQALYNANFTPATTNLTASVIGHQGLENTPITGTVRILTARDAYRIDRSPNNHTIGSSGSPQFLPISPFAPTQAYVPSQLGGSAYFDGSDSLQVPSNPLFNYSSTDMTVELWLYLLTIPAEGAVLELGTGATSDIQLVVVSSTGGISFGTSGRAKTWVTVTVNQWYHIAGVKSGSTYYLYVNGTRYTTESGNSNSSSTTVNIGSRNSTTNYLTGYISNYKISNYARYNTTTIPIPTTPAVPDANTSLLLNFTNGGIVDATGRNNLETVGNSAVQTTQSRWPPGSMYFDGNGDYLVAPSSQFWTLGSTEDFTIEFWFYTSVTVPISGSTPSTLISNYPDWNTWTNRWAIATNDNKIKWYDHTGNPAIASNNFTYSVWNHVAVVRSSSSIKMYINGTQEGSTQTTNQTYTSTEKLYVGLVPSGAAFNGYIDDLRITKGYARYVAGTGGNAGQMVFNGTTTLAFPTINTRPFPLA